MATTLHRARKRSANANHKSRRRVVQSVMGKYAKVKTSSRQFAASKRREVAREGRGR